MTAFYFPRHAAIVFVQHGSAHRLPSSVPFDELRHAFRHECGNPRFALNRELVLQYNLLLLHVETIRSIVLQGSAQSKLPSHMCINML